MGSTEHVGDRVLKAMRAYCREIAVRSFAPIEQYRANAECGPAEDAASGAVEEDEAEDAPKVAWLMMPGLGVQLPHAVRRQG
jgi:hypothetical protein